MRHPFKDLNVRFNTNEEENFWTNKTRPFTVLWPVYACQKVQKYKSSSAANTEQKQTNKRKIQYHGRRLNPFSWHNRYHLKSSLTEQLPE